MECSRRFKHAELRLQFQGARQCSFVRGTLNLCLSGLSVTPPLCSWPALMHIQNLEETSAWTVGTHASAIGRSHTAMFAELERVPPPLCPGWLVQLPEIHTLLPLATR
eukprot:6479202-Amphidinium_carterae.2